MKGGLILLGRHGGREAAALLIDGQVEDLLVEPPADRQRVGAIYRGKAGRPMKGRGGIFVDLVGGTGFLRRTQGVSPGRGILVQVAGYAERGKAAPLTDRPVIRGRHVILTLDAPGHSVSRRIRDEAGRARLLDVVAGIDLPGETGLILRSAAEHADPDDLAHEARELSSLAHRILADDQDAPSLLLPGAGPHAMARIDWGPHPVESGEDAFAIHGVDAAIDAMLRPDVPLPGGGRMTIEPTRALVAIDVDTGGDTSPAAALKADIAAARILPRELRCRGLGGQITIDFAPIPRRDRHRVEQALSAAFRRDVVETTVAGWTPLSHMELQRKRVRLPLTECLGP